MFEMKEFRRYLDTKGMKVVGNRGVFSFPLVSVKTETGC